MPYQITSRDLVATEEGSDWLYLEPGGGDYITSHNITCGVTWCHKVTWKDEESTPVVLPTRLQSIQYTSCLTCN